MEQPLTIEQKARYLKIGMSLCGIVSSDKAAELIATIYEGILEKGGEFSLSDTCKIEAMLDDKYKPKQH